MADAMSHPSIRAAAPADANLLLDMMDDFNRLEAIAWTRATCQPALETLLSSPDLGAVGLVIDGDDVRGYFVVTWGFDLEWSGRDAFLTELYLRPDARAHGLGRAVLPLIEAFAAGHGARALHLMVRPENEAAVRLYRSAGFTSPPRIFLTKEVASAG